VNASIVDLAHDAELLETCTKRNDKYTVRRILDVHYSYFRIKQSSQSECAQKKNSIDASIYNSSGGGETLLKSGLGGFSGSFNNKKCVPSIFLNILHLAIENNSMDVLRICLKYGLNPNEPGTTLRKLYLDKNMFSNYDEDLTRLQRKSVRYPVKCGYCKVKAAKEKSALMVKQTTVTQTVTATTTTTTTTCLNSNIKQSQTLLYEFEAKETQTLNNLPGTTRTTIVIDDVDSDTELSPQIASLDQIDYSSFLYLIRLPPLFLSISKCNHAATDLLLTYGACPNVQDDLGNFFCKLYFYESKNE
jgi:hypothetical protein